MAGLNCFSDCCNCCGAACPFPRWKFYYECFDNGSCNCCFTTGSLVVSGAGGAFANCAFVNGSFTMTSLGSCVWTSGTDTTPSNIWLITWNGTYWQVNSLDSLVTFSAGSGPCPASGSLTLISNSCTGSPVGTLTVTNPIDECNCEYIVTLTGDVGGISVSGGVATSLVDQNISGTITSSPSTSPCSDNFCPIFVRINGGVSPQPVLAGGTITVTIDTSCTECNEIGPVCEQSFVAQVRKLNGKLQLLLDVQQIKQKISSIKRKIKKH